jgi:sugar phosphate isomerase/epimerase
MESMNPLSPVNDMPSLLLSTGCLFHLPLEQSARIGRAAGFTGLEVIMNSPELVPGSGLELVDAILPIRSFHAPFRHWAQWGGHLASWQATTVLANSLPLVDHIVMHPPGTRLANMIQNRWFEKACDLPLLLNAKGRITFSLENMPWVVGSPFSRDPLEILLATCRDKNVGLTFDVCHMGVSGRDVLHSLAQVPVQMLYNVHFSDAAGYTEHLTPGAGVLPLDDVLRYLGKIEYQRYVTLELEPSAFPCETDGIIEKLTRIRESMEIQMAIGRKDKNRAPEVS